MGAAAIREAEQRIRDEMHRHREATPATKAAPKREPFSDYQLQRLVGGVCEDVADPTPRCERRVKQGLFICLAVVIIGAIGKALRWW